MGRYYEFDKDVYAHAIPEGESIYGAFSHDNPLFIQRALKRTALHQAVCSSDYDEAEIILKRGKVDVNQQDAHGNTALHLAFANQHFFPELYEKIIALLQRNGAKNNIANHYGDTPEKLAKEHTSHREKLAIMFDQPPYDKRSRSH